MVIITIVMIMSIVVVVMMATAALGLCVFMRSGYRRPASGLLGEIRCRLVIVLSIHRQFSQINSLHFKYERTTSINSSAPFERSA
ncbi:MAG: hypothetical protein JWL65_6236 [Gammaproteobacteria bacterium]|nr:hypothetical protein [Gammaproteobacteria bacterium]